MKWFFWGLLGVNLVLFVWNWQHAGAQVNADTRSPVATTIAGPRLVLLQELDVPLSERSTVAAPRSLPGMKPTGPAAKSVIVQQRDVSGAGVAVISAVSCLRLGGLESQAIVASVARALSQGGATVRRQGDEVGEITRYWVMLPPAATAAAAMPALERLQRAGIKDFYLIRSGENANAISLGVFSGEASAQRRIQQIRELKLVAHIEAITLPAKRWWLEFEWSNDGVGKGWRTLLPGELRDTPPLACQ